MTDFTWPEGKTFGELTPEQKRSAARAAARQLAAELEANADQIAAILSPDVPEDAPKWNCVSYPGEGMHYLGSGGECLWCGKSELEIRREYDRP